MLSLNNTYFIGSVYAGMLWSLGDVTKQFHVNLFDVQKKNLYRLLLCGLFVEGSGTKHECHGQERDKTRILRAGAGPDKIYFCRSGRARDKILRERD